MFPNEKTVLWPRILLVYNQGMSEREMHHQGYLHVHLRRQTVIMSQRHARKQINVSLAS